MAESLLRDFIPLKPIFIICSDASQNAFCGSGGFMFQELVFSVSRTCFVNYFTFNGLYSFAFTAIKPCPHTLRQDGETPATTVRVRTAGHDCRRQRSSKGIYFLSSSTFL